MRIFMYKNFLRCFLVSTILCSCTHVIASLEHELENSRCAANVVIQALRTQEFKRKLMHCAPGFELAMTLADTLALDSSIIIKKILLSEPSDLLATADNEITQIKEAYKESLAHAIKKRDVARVGHLLDVKNKLPKTSVAQFIELLNEYVVHPDMPSKYQSTLLHHAVFANSPETVNDLICMGVGVNREDNTGILPCTALVSYEHIYGRGWPSKKEAVNWLAIACIFITKTSKITIPGSILAELSKKCCTELRERLANLNVPLETSIYQKLKDLLSEAGDQQAIEQTTNICSFLLNCGANPNGTRGTKRMTPLHMAAYLDLRELAEELIKASACIEALDENNRTPLQVAVQNDNINLVQLLLSNGANPNAFHKSGMTPLFNACTVPYKSTVHLLLARNANVNQAGRASGEVPLHAMCYLTNLKDFYMKADLLIKKYGANCTIRCHEKNETPCESVLARSSQADISVELAEKYQAMVTYLTEAQQRQYSRLCQQWQHDAGTFAACLHNRCGAPSPARILPANAIEDICLRAHPDTFYDNNPDCVVPLEGTGTETSMRVLNQKDFHV